jgi:hypothetical protein
MIDWKAESEIFTNYQVHVDVIIEEMGLRFFEVQRLEI